MGGKFTIFAFSYFVLEGKFQEQAARGTYIRRGDLTEGFLRYDFGGLIFGGAYTWRGLYFRNFTVNVDNPNIKLYLPFRNVTRRAASSA